MARPLNEQVVVLTGASSGIGRATAVELGRRGARVVLAARGEDGLRDAAREVESAGGRALAVPTDVTDFSQTERLARAAAEHFGRIDTWINDAGVGLFATVDDSTVAEIEQVLRVNLFGAIHGMKAALPVMRRQGAGTIVNVASALGKFSSPLMAAYCASKHGLIGFADALRVELMRDGSPIQVATVLPSSVDTPFFESGRSKLGGKMARPIPPAYDPQAVADAVVRVCERPQRDVVVGLSGRLFILLNRISPALLDWVLVTTDAEAQQTSDRPATTSGNLFGPIPGTKPTHGGWDGLNVGGSPYTRWWAQSPAVRAAALGVAGAVGLGVARWLTGEKKSIYERAPHREALAAVAD